MNKLKRRHSVARYLAAYVSTSGLTDIWLIYNMAPFGFKAHTCVMSGLLRCGWEENVHMLPL